MLKHTLASGLLILGLAAIPAVAQQGVNVVVDRLPLPDQAMMEGGRVMVPLRGIFEKLGAEVRYDPATRQIRATRGPKLVELTLGSRGARVDGQDVTLDVPADTLGGKTMVPLRFVSESMGAEVHWQEATRTVEIESGGASAARPAEPEPVQPPPPVRPPERPPDRDRPWDHDRDHDRDRDRDHDHGRHQVSATVFPADGAVLRIARPSIEASFNQPVRTDTVRLLLDGHEVTRQASVDPKLVHFVPSADLSPGPHRADLEAVDVRGGFVNQTWSFAIRPDYQQPPRHIR